MVKKQSVNLKSFYKGKKVLITGHTGFKGAWLALILTMWGAKVSGYALKPPTKPSLYKALKLDKKMNSRISDIRNYKKFYRFAKKVKPDLIFHLAAQPLVRDSYDMPLYTFETNVIGTANVLETIRNLQIRAAVIVTTDKVYENIEDPKKLYREGDKLCGHDPYSNSKSCADLATDSYIKSFFDLKSGPFVATARSGNVIGGGDWAKDRLVPDMARAFWQEKKPVVIRSPHSMRPWQHVFEPLSGYLLLGKELFEGNKKAVGAWNFAPEPKDMAEVLDLVKLFISSAKRGEFKINPDKAKHEAKNLKLSNLKSKRILGWKTKLDFRASVDKTAKWYQAFYQKEDILELSEKQIKQYFR